MFVWDHGSLKARSMPANLCHALRVVPEHLFLGFNGALSYWGKPLSLGRAIAVGGCA